MKHKLLWLLIGWLFGNLIGALITLHVVTNQVQARNARMTLALEGKAAEDDKDFVRFTQIKEGIAALKARAENCEAKFIVGTIVYQNQDVASIPLMHGSVALTIGGAQGASRPSLYIPAQVDIYTNRPDVRYEWIDGRTGSSKGVQIARHPSEAQ